MPNDLRATGHQQAWSWPLSDWDRMWRPSCWLNRPPKPHKTHILHLFAILALVGYANIIANEVLDEVWHIPFNLGILGVAILIARRAGTTWTTMGLRRDRIKRGVTVGGVVIAVIVAGVAIGIAMPATRELFRDDRIIESSVGWVLFQAFVRIPLATALYEEVLFRGIVFGMLIRRRSPLVAGLMTSVLFGLWHILPTLDTLQTSPAGDLFTGIVGLVVAIVGAIAGTFVAGLGFLWVRLYANSTYASVLAHIGTNSVAILGSLLVVHLLS
jgi:membrane protease YdiL (CAAX protease family)